MGLRLSTLIGSEVNMSILASLCMTPVTLSKVNRGVFGRPTAFNRTLKIAVSVEGFGVRAIT